MKMPPFLPFGTLFRDAMIEAIVTIAPPPPTIEELSSAGYLLVKVPRLYIELPPVELPPVERRS